MNMIFPKKIEPQQIQFAACRPNPFGFELASDTPAEFIVRLDTEGVEYVLSRMHERQRVPSEASVVGFVELIESGKFVEGMHPGIYFDRHGFAVNARHRLTAQKRTGKTLTWRMKIGASPEEVAALDQVRARRIHQSINLTGEDKMSNREEASLRQCARLARSTDGLISQDRRVTQEHILEARSLFGVDVKAVMEAVPSSAAPASLVGALAFCRQVAPEEIGELCETFVNCRLALGGREYAQNAPGVTLARFMNTASGGRAGGEYTNEVMYKTLAAARAQVLGETIGKLYSPKSRNGQEPEAFGALVFFQKKRQELGINLPLSLE
jgi:hypothetical protein